jgi:hypothetical protein
MNIDIDYIDDANICVCVSGTDHFNVGVDRELSREQFPVSSNGMNDDIDYDYDNVTYLRPTFIDRVDGDREVNMDRLRELIEKELNK